MQHSQVPQTKPMLTIQESVKTCLRKYADFSGRATRAEYWWWVLATFLVSLAIGSVETAFGAVLSAIGLIAFTPFSTLFSLAIVLPNLAVTARRLHDIGKSGWWQLVWIVISGAAWVVFAIGLVISLFLVFAGGDWGRRGMEHFRDALDFGDLAPAIITFAFAMLVSLGVVIWLLVWMVRQGETGPNRYGLDPRAPDDVEPMVPDAI